MTPTSPFPEGSSPASAGGQGLWVFRRLSDCRIAAGKSLRKVNGGCLDKKNLVTVLEVSMNHVAL